MGHLIYLDGIDGAGKTTVLRTLRNWHHSPDLLFVGKAEFTAPSADQDAYLRELNAVVYQRPRHVADLCGDRYWLFAVAAWYQLLDAWVVRPAVEAGRTVVMDNSPLKIIARYLAANLVDGPLVEQCFAGLREPDLVLILTVSAEEALRRKVSYTTVEAGGTRSTEEFLAFQAGLGQALANSDGKSSGRLAAAARRVVIDTTGRSIEAVAEEVWREILPALHSSQHTQARS